MSFNFLLSKVGDLRELMSKEQIIYLESSDKKDVLEEMIDHLCGLKLVENKKLVLTRLIDREKLASTGLGEGVAFPHARIEVNKNLVMAIGISKKGIDFDAVDSNPVYLVILILWHPSVPGLFNQLFRDLVKPLQCPAFKNKIINGKTAEEVHSLLSELRIDISLKHKEFHCGNLLLKLQELENKKKKAKKNQLTKIKRQINLLREDIDSGILLRFDRLMEHYGFAVVKLKDGICQGCNIGLPVSIKESIRENYVLICENCGKFMVS